MVLYEEKNTYYYFRLIPLTELFRYLQINVSNLKMNHEENTYPQYFLTINC